MSVPGNYFCFYIFFMDHIFGDSHDIAFGANTPVKSTSTTPAPKSTVSARKVHHDDFWDLDVSPRPSPKPPRSTTAVRPPMIHEPRLVRTQTPEKPRMTDRPLRPASVTPDPINIPTLTRLIDGMKSSFLPREEDTSVVRLVSLSVHGTPDPLTLVTRDDTTILIGSGFGSMTRAGQNYHTFPDMRLIASEKTRLGAWILLDAHIDVRPFQTILPGIWFPPIYATRDIIAKFRNNITDTAFLSQCRFFELFTEGMTERSIGDIEFCAGKSLILKSGETEVAFSQYPLGGAVVAPELTMSSDGYMLASQLFTSGEILTLRGSKIEKHSMKFTFDTFFIDKNSVGVAAGYTLGDREQLAENGVLMFTLEEDTRARTIAGHIFIDSRGFVHAHEMMSVHKEVLKGIRATYEKLITENPKIDRGSLVQWLRRELTKYCYLLTGRTPVVMPILIER